MNPWPKTLLPSALLGVVLIAGCTSGLAGGALGGLTPGNATLSVVAAVQDGQFQTQAVLDPYTKASIDHVKLALYTVANGQETAVLKNGSPVGVDLASGSLDTPFTFDNLHNDTTYRVKAAAYKAPGTALADLISTQDASSSLDIRIDKDLTPPLQTVPVKLIDRLFSAKGTSSLAVTDGSYTYLNETMTLAPLTFSITGTKATWWSLDGGQTTYATSHTFNPAVDTSKLGTALINGNTYYVLPATFVNNTTDFIRIDDGIGFNADGSWTRHYLGLLPSASGSLNLVVSGTNVAYTIYYP